MTRAKKAVLLVVFLVLIAGAFTAGIAAKDKATKEKAAKLLCKMKKLKLLKR